MIVYSFRFLIFFSVVFFVYYLALKNSKQQNVWLLLCSYFFYGYAAWKMLPLLFVATCLFYGIGIAIGHYNEHDEKKASVLTTVGVLTGVGVLLYFKYLNFFIESFSDFFNAIGLQSNLHTFNIILPLGISFFTFKLISYVIEVHRGHIPPCKDWIAFATYVSFFPTIMSGPIDRPKQFLGQLSVNRSFNYGMAVDGCRQILWGMLKKMVVADNLALVVDTTWGDIGSQSGLTLIIVIFLYSIQLYMDFSGYSDMAIGVGKLLGIKVAINFKYPYFATNIAEYWRRWHMSLTSWLADYVFMPLNFKLRNWGNLGLISAIIINLLAVGMWHGANYTFAVFGLFHGLLFIPLVLSGSLGKKRKMKLGKFNLPTIQDFSKMVFIFCLVSLARVVFRADSLEQAWEYLSQIFMGDIPFFSKPKFGFGIKRIIQFVTMLIFVMEWYAYIKKKEYALQLFSSVHNRILRWSLYYFLVTIIFIFNGKQQDFIYVGF